MPAPAIGASKPIAIDDFSFSIPIGGQGSVDHVWLNASNWLLFVGWVRMPRPGQLTVRSGLALTQGAFLERDEIAATYGAHPDSVRGFRLHAIDRSSLHGQLLDIEVCVDGQCVLPIIVKVPPSDLPAVSLAAPGPAALVDKLSPSLNGGVCKIADLTEAPVIRPYTSGELRLMRQIGAIGLEIGAPARDLAFDNLIVISDPPYPSSTLAGGFAELPFPGATFDFVIVNDVHTTPFSEVDRVLKPGGLLSATPEVNELARRSHGYIVQGSGVLPQKPGTRSLVWPSETVWPKLLDLTPPEPLMNAIGSLKESDFRIIGRVFLSYFIQLGNLKPHHRVLDIGCGCGRMAMCLASFLDAKGSYEGFDINPDLLAWCQTNLEPLRSGFKFELMHRYGKMYNPAFTPPPPEPERRPWYSPFRSGKQPAPRKFAFPYASSDFDLISASSVFTHLLPDDTAQYLCEVARTLKPGGRCLLTFFVLNEVSARCWAVRSRCSASNIPSRSTARRSSRTIRKSPSPMTRATCVSCLKSRGCGSWSRSGSAIGPADRANSPCRT